MADFCGFAKKPKQNCKKPLTDSRGLHICRLTERDAARNDGASIGRQHRRTTGPPKEKIGERWLSASFRRFGADPEVARWLFDIVGLDEGTCGRRRPVRRASGSDDRFFKPMPYMSFVSITFDKCRYRLPKFGIAVGGVRSVPCIS